MQYAYKLHLTKRTVKRAIYNEHLNYTTLNGLYKKQYTPYKTQLTIYKGNNTQSTQHHLSFDKEAWRGAGGALMRRQFLTGEFHTVFVSHKPKKPDFAHLQAGAVLWKKIPLVCS